ncbi:hypothetical protein J2Z84_003594 [Agrobacterium rubi]|nr:hypothetical protein [Agrobacterium rubi]
MLRTQTTARPQSLAVASFRQTGMRSRSRYDHPF